MPYVRILWKEEHLDEASVARLCSTVPAIVGEALEAADPDHRVRTDMVDVRVERVGPLDQIHPAMLVSVYAREEPLRFAQRDQIVASITANLSAAGSPPGTMIELILSHRASSYEYPIDE